MDTYTTGKLYISTVSVFPVYCITFLRMYPISPSHPFLSLLWALLNVIIFTLKGI